MLLLKYDQPKTLLKRIVFGWEFIFFSTGDNGETKKKYGENEEYMSHLVSYKWFRKTQVIPELGGFNKKWG